MKTTRSLETVIKSLSLCALLLLVFALAGCGGAAGTSVTVNDVGNVDGVITNASGNPISGAMIQIGSQVATTSSNGTYSLTGVSIGNRTITVTTSGYQNSYGTVIVQKGTTVSYNIQLMPTATSNTGSIAGTISSQSGGQLSGATVVIDNNSAVTNITGQFAINNLTAATHTITVSMSGYQTVTSTVTIQSGVTALYNIQLVPVSTNNTGGVTGKITSSLGVSLAGATVNVNGVSTVSGQSGDYTLTNIAAGSYPILVSLNGYQSYSGTVTVFSSMVTQDNITLTAVPAASTKAILKIALAGTLPANTAIAGAGFTLMLPADVTPALANGSVTSGVVALTGVMTGNSIQPQVAYTPASGATQGSMHIVLASSYSAGISIAGEIVTVTLQLANGVTPAIANFNINGTNVYDTNLAPISGLSVQLASVTLQ